MPRVGVSCRAFCCAMMTLTSRQQGTSLSFVTTFKIHSLAKKIMHWDKFGWKYVRNYLRGSLKEDLPWRPARESGKWTIKFVNLLVCGALGSVGFGTVDREISFSLSERERESLVYKCQTFFRVFYFIPQTRAFCSRCNFRSFIVSTLWLVIIILSYHRKITSPTLAWNRHRRVRTQSLDPLGCHESLRPRQRICQCSRLN